MIILAFNTLLILLFISQSFEPRQLERGLVLLPSLLDLNHPSLQLLAPPLRLPNDHRCDGDVVYLVLGDDVELVGEAAQQFRRCPQGHCDLACHPHSDLNSYWLTGPISLSCTLA